MKQCCPFQALPKFKGMRKKLKLTRITQLISIIRNSKPKDYEETHLLHLMKQIVRKRLRG